MDSTGWTVILVNTVFWTGDGCDLEAYKILRPSQDIVKRSFGVKAALDWILASQYHAIFARYSLRDFVNRIVIPALPVIERGQI